MSDSNFDLLPSSERFQKRMERMKKSAKEYAEGRERVRGQPEKIAEDLERQENLSEMLLRLHEEEEELKEQLGADLENVTGALQNYDAKQWEDFARAFAQGNYTFAVDAGKNGKAEISVAIDLPEGNIQEKIPLTQTLQERIASQALGKGSGAPRCPKCSKGILIEMTSKHQRVWKCSACGHIVKKE